MAWILIEILQKNKIEEINATNLDRKINPIQLRDRTWAISAEIKNDPYWIKYRHIYANNTVIEMDRSRFVHERLTDLLQRDKIIMSPDQYQYYYDYYNKRKELFD